MTDGIQQISDEELSRWIAEKLEPKPICDERGDFNGDVPDWIDDEDYGDFYLSDAGAWLFIYQGNGGWKHFQRDMVNDAQMTLMLLEKIGLVRIARQFNVGWRIVLEDSTTVIDNRKLGRAVAEAFALSQGYPGTLDRTTKE